MIEGLIYYFATTWLVAFLALLAGRFIGSSPPPMAGTFGKDLLIYLQVWGLTALAKFGFSLLGHGLDLSESFQSGMAGFLLPIAVGGYFARHLLRLHEQRALMGTKSSQATTK